MGQFPSGLWTLSGYSWSSRQSYICNTEKALSEKESTGNWERIVVGAGEGLEGSEWHGQI